MTKHRASSSSSVLTICNFDSSSKLLEFFPLLISLTSLKSTGWQINLLWNGILTGKYESCTYSFVGLLLDHSQFVPDNLTGPSLDGQMPFFRSLLIKNFQDIRANLELRYSFLQIIERVSITEVVKSHHGTKRFGFWVSRNHKGRTGYDKFPDDSLLIWEKCGYKMLGTIMNH